MLTTILATIFVLGVLVFFHELGHFLVAKKSGIRVEKFSLGFPPAIISKKYGETTYAIGLIPLGGYVKMAGENPYEETTGEPWEFMSKPLWKRFLVIFAGPFMNFILAVVVLAGLYFFRGKEIDSVFIGDVEKESPAEIAGILPGAKILSLDGTPIKSFSQMADIVSQKAGQSIFIEWEQNGRMYADSVGTYVDHPVTVAGDTVEITRIGVTSKVVFERMSFFGAVATGFNQSIYYVQKFFEFVWGLLSRKVDVSVIWGPIVISKYAGATARAGFTLLLEFLALLSINLAVLNVLPIPVLDGGHLLFLLIERFKGSPLSIKSRLVAQQIGMAFLLILIIFVTYNDIANH